MKVKLYIIYLSIIAVVPLSAAQTQYTAQDLQNNYSAITQQLQGFKNSVASLPSSSQDSLPTDITDALNQVNQIYNATNAQIQPYSTQTQTARTKAIINNYVSIAIQQMQKQVKPVELQVQQIQSQLPKTNAASPGESNPVQALIDNFSTTISQINASVAAKQQDWQNRIQALQNLIAAFSGSDKQSLTNAINQAQSLMNGLEGAISELLNDALKDLTTIKNNASSKNLSLDETKQQINARISLAIAEVNKKINTVERIIKDAENNAAVIKQRQEKSSIKPDYQAQEAYHQKIVQLMKNTAPIMGQFLALDPLAKKVLRAYISSGQYDSATIEQITSQCLHYIQLMADAYKNNGFTVHSFDAGNYVLIMAHWLSNFFNSLIQHQVQFAKTKIKDPNYFHLMALIAENILGSQDAADPLVKKVGYSGVINSIAQNYFADMQDSINSYYLQKIVESSHTSLFNALNSMSAQLIKPTDQQLHDALTIYTQLNINVKSFPADKQSDQLVSLNQSIGLMYANSATQALKQVSLTQDSSAFVTFAATQFGLSVQYYTAAAQAASAQSERQKEFSVIAQTYQTISTNLSQAINYQKQAIAAENEGNISSAIDLYASAESAFKAANDQVDATRMNIKHQLLLGNQSIALAKDHLQKFVTAYKTQFQQYIDYLELKNNGPMSNFDSLIKNWMDAVQEIYSSYQQAFQSYKSLSSFNNEATQSSVMQQFDALNSVVQMMDLLTKAQTFMSSGDQYAQNKDINSLSQANQNYAQALSLFGQVDSLFSSKQTLKQLFPIYPALMVNDQKWNYSTVASNHIARLYLEIADQTVQYDLLTTIQYYTAAANYGNLSAELKEEINNKLQSVTKQMGQFDDLFKQAQQSQQSAEQLTVTDWNSTAQAYTSKADTQWRGVINQYFTLYQLGYKPAQDAYSAAVKKYAQLYQKNVGQDFFPSLGLALIYYRLYLLLLAQNSSDAQSYADQISASIKTYFNAAQSLLAQINDNSQLSQAPDNIDKFSNWYAQFKQGLEQQELIANSFQGKIAKVPVLLAQKIDPITKIITCQDVLNNSSIQFSPIREQQADIYKKAADSDFKQQKYDKAQLGYSKAIALYHALGKDDAANQLQQQYSISLAHMFNDLVIPQDSVSIASFVAAKSYQLKVYSQLIPKQLMQQFGDPTKLSKNDLTNFEISVAVSLFLYHKITDLGLDYFSLMSQLNANKIPSDLTQDQQNAILQATQQANDFKKDLTERMNKKPTLGLRGQQENGQAVTYLEEYYKPIPAIPSTPPIYQGYPSAYSYIYYGLLLAAPPLAPGAQVQIGTTLYVPGNDADLYSSLSNNLAQLYFSQGYSYQQALNDIKNCSAKDCTWQKLKTAQNNPQAVLTDFMPLYNTMNEKFNLMTAYYNIPFNYFIPPANIQPIIKATPQITSSFNQNLGSLYEQFGDDLQNFLIGNPLDTNYNTILTAISTQYTTAAVYYNTIAKMTAMEQKIATVFKNAGDKVVAQDNYFGAIGLYYTAEQAYQKLPSLTPDAQTQLDSVYVTRLATAFKGATNNIAQYQAAKLAPITIKLSTGQTQPMTLDALLQNYTNWLSQHGGLTTGFDPGELCTYNYYNGLLLDALIFYTATSLEFNKKLTAIVGNASADQLKTINKNGENVLNKYLSSNSISLDTLDQVQQFMTRPDMKNILLQGFEQFKAMALSADKNAVIQGYSALAQFNSKLNTAFGLVYMNDYLGGVSPEAWNNLAEALKAETDEIRAPSKYYVGDICKSSE